MAGETVIELKEVSKFFWLERGRPESIQEAFVQFFR